VLRREIVGADRPGPFIADLKFPTLACGVHPKPSHARIRFRRFIEAQRRHRGPPCAERV
jgi:hypothetical protein